MKRISTTWIWWLAGAGVAGAIGWSFVPSPVSVETATIVRGPLVVTVDEDARTRVHDRFSVAAPVGGQLARIPYRPGARVRPGEIVARIFASPPAPLDSRTRSQLEARVAAAADALEQARRHADSARVALEQSTSDLARQRRLEGERVIAPQELENAQARQRVAEQDARASTAGVDVAAHELEAARAALLVADSGGRGRATDVRAPRAGAILRVFEESERAVQPGTPLVEIGDPGALEIVADLLSTDAVQVRQGARVFIERWGGAGTLHGRVRLVEPSSATKVSALGVEEQRVNVIIDFADPPAVWCELGDGFAVEVRVVVWERDEVVKVPVSALFRRGGDWAVFKIVGTRAVEQRVTIGRSNSVEASVDQGVADGDLVVVHPSERLESGSRVAVRPGASPSP